MTGTAAVGSPFCRMRQSLRDSAGEIVFGMSDGAVSIFGLVLGVAAGAQSGNVILLAGATAAIAATVSMMAGVYLELESERDEARVQAEQREREIRRDPDLVVGDLIATLEHTGLSRRSLDSIRDDMKADPLTIRRFEDAVACEEETPAQKVPPIVHACWMGTAGFLAAMTPVIPFAFLPLPEAKIVCITGTAVLLILLGIGRARIGNRNVVRTVLETVAIAIAAAIAGVFVGWLIG